MKFTMKVIHENCVFGDCDVAENENKKQEDIT